MFGKGTGNIIYGTIWKSMKIKFILIDSNIYIFLIFFRFTYRSNRVQHISSIPSNNEKDAWLNEIAGHQDLNNITNHATVCNLHFSPDCIKEGKLCPHAKPTIFPIRNRSVFGNIREYNSMDCSKCILLQFISVYFCLFPFIHFILIY